MKPRPTIPTLLQSPKPLEQMLDGILRAVERVMDKPRRKNSTRTVEIGAPVEYNAKTA